MPKVAAIQMCSSHVVDENLQTAAKLIEEAASNGAELIVLPEMFSVFAFTPPETVKEKETYGVGRVQTFLAEQAKKHRVWIVGGTTPISCDDPNRARSACIVFDAEGKIVARYDKIHLFDVVLSDTESYKESDTIQPGNEVVVLDSPLGKLGFAVCYDVRFPALFRELANRGAEIICLPAAFTVKTGEAHWEVLTRARAIENFSYVIAAAQAGTHTSGRKTFGHSMIVDPWGTVVAEMDGKTVGIIYADIDLDKLHEIRKSIPVKEHQRDF